jgi:hypothetical protein
VASDEQFENKIDRSCRYDWDHRDAVYDGGASGGDMRVFVQNCFVST